MTGAPIYLVSACTTGDEFVAAFRRYADKSGLFVPIGEPLPAGRRSRFAVTLKDGGVMIEGEAEVISAARTPSVLHGRIGMTLRFLEPDDASKTMLAELEKARLAMKPPPPSVAPRPAEIPASPRPVPPPAQGRIDAVNALAECVAIGDPALIAPLPPAPLPPKAGPKFVVPSIPGSPRPNTSTSQGLGLGLGRASRPTPPPSAPQVPAAALEATQPMPSHLASLPTPPMPVPPLAKPPAEPAEPVQTQPLVPMPTRSSSDTMVTVAPPPTTGQLPAVESSSSVPVPVAATAQSAPTDIGGVLLDPQAGENNGGGIDEPRSRTQIHAGVLPSELAMGFGRGSTPAQLLPDASSRQLPLGLHDVEIGEPTDLTTMPLEPPGDAPLVSTLADRRQQRKTVIGLAVGPSTTLPPTQLAVASGALTVPHTAVGDADDHDDTSPGREPGTDPVIARETPMPLVIEELTPIENWTLSPDGVPPPGATPPIEPTLPPEVTLSPETALPIEPPGRSTALRDAAPPARETLPLETVQMPPLFRTAADDGEPPVSHTAPTVQMAPLLRPVEGASASEPPVSHTAPTVQMPPLPRPGAKADTQPSHDELLPDATVRHETLSAHDLDLAVPVEGRKAPASSPAGEPAPAQAGKAKPPTGDWTIERDPGAPDGWSSPFSTIPPHEVDAATAGAPAAAPPPAEPAAAPAPTAAAPAAEPPAEPPRRIKPRPDEYPILEPKVQIDPTLIESSDALAAAGPSASGSLPPAPYVVATPGAIHSAPTLDLKLSASGAGMPGAPRGPLSRPPEAPAYALDPSYQMVPVASVSPAATAHDLRFGSGTTLPVRRVHRRVVLVVVTALVAVAIGAAAVAMLTGKRDGSTTGNGVRTLAAPPPTATADNAPGSAAATPLAATGSGSSVAPPRAPTGSGGVAAPPPCYVDVTSTPPGAEIVVAEIVVLGTTPKQITMPCGGPVNLQIRKARYATVTQTVTPTPEAAKLKITLTRDVISIKVSSTPEGATITMNGKLVGITPTTVRLPAGESSTLLIAKDGYDSETERVTPKPSGTSIHTDLKRAKR